MGTRSPTMQFCTRAQHSNPSRTVNLVDTHANACIIASHVQRMLLLDPTSVTSEFFLLSCACVLHCARLPVIVAFCRSLACLALV